MMSIVDPEPRTTLAHILIVEDEPEIRELIALHLRRCGFSTTEVSDASQALHAVEHMQPDLICLDWMLPGVGGIEFLKMLRMRDANAAIPVLMLTAKSEPEDIVAGLETGADDYLTKPFEPKVLQARVRALLRRFTRGNEGERTEVLTIGNLEIDLRSYEVRVDGEKIHLTPSEFKLLSTMSAHVGRVLTRDKLIQEVQGEGIAVVGRTIDTHIFGLRKKLKTAGDLIETIRGIGYRVKDS